MISSFSIRTGVRVIAVGFGILLATGSHGRDRDDIVFKKPTKTTKSTAADSSADAKPKPASDASLFDRLGGEAAITAVVHEFLKKCASDPIIKKRFEGANLPRLRNKLIEQLVAATGGPRVYTGLDMRTAHAGMNITEAEFNALVKNLIVTMKEFKVPQREQNEILGALGPMKSDIVVKKPTTMKGRVADLDKRLGRIESSLAGIQRRLETAGPTALSTTAGDTATSTPPFAFTPEEVQFAPSLIDRYQDGEATKPPASDESTQLLNEPLAQTRFLGADGQVVDLKALQGKQPVVLVIMRGFAGTVCVNCSAQLVALSRRKDELKSRNAAVLVVYPGEASSVPAFLEATRTIAGNFVLPFSLLLDVNLVAVRTFNIEGSLAKPSTLILDKNGIVRWAYVGQQPGDRPTVDSILKELDTLH
jgi:hemoglobin